MGVTIHRIERRGANLLLQAEISRKADFALLQEVFRDCVSSKLSVETYFGLDENYKAKAGFDYPCGVILSLIYDGDSNRVGLTFTKKGPRTIPIKPPELEVLKAELVEMVRGSRGGKRPAARQKTKGKKEPPAEQ